MENGIRNTTSDNPCPSCGCINGCGQSMQDAIDRARDEEDYIRHEAKRRGVSEQQVWYDLREIAEGMRK